jgi:DnaJ homolog subfamily C member 8
MADLDQYLRLEANQFNQEQEVERILKYKDGKDPLLILDMPLDCYITLQVPDGLIKKVFRKKSLRVHPDKNPHPDARIAFEELQKAQLQLEDFTKRKVVMNFVKEARDSIFHQQGIELPRLDRESELLLFLEKYPNIGRLVQLECMKLANELEYRDAIRRKNEEGRESLLEQIEKARRKEKEEFEKNWEDSRVDRIKSWQKFASKGVKKKKKEQPLGALPKGLKKK